MFLQFNVSVHYKDHWYCYFCESGYKKLDMSSYYQNLTRSSLFILHWFLSTFIYISYYNYIYIKIHKKLKSTKD